MKGMHPSTTLSTLNADPTMLSQQELAVRWGRSVSYIGLSSAMGLGPKYVQHAGALKYPVEEVQKYERALRMH